MKIETTDLGELGLHPSPAVRGALETGQIAGLPVLRAVSEVPEPVDRWGAEVRSANVAAWRAGLAPLSAPPQVLASLDQLARPGTLAVVTGQQPVSSSARSIR
ncbi:MAG: hypothetical protein R3E96_09415 [Planctomycetota bacterium]